MMSLKKATFLIKQTSLWSKTCSLLFSCFTCRSAPVHINPMLNACHLSFSDREIKTSNTGKTKLILRIQDRKNNHKTKGSKVHIVTINTQETKNQSRAWGGLDRRHKRDASIFYILSVEVTIRHKKHTLKQSARQRTKDGKRVGKSDVTPWKY